jgi:hypothetical protein
VAVRTARLWGDEAGGTAARGPRAGAAPVHSTAFTMSSTTFFASPNTIIVLSM